MAKYCSNCGAELNDEQDVCLKCGVRVKNTNDAYYSESVKRDKNFVKNAIEEMSRYIRNWDYMSAKEKNNIGASLTELKARVEELMKVINDSKK